jgi:hypothetical protein
LRISENTDTTEFSRINHCYAEGNVGSGSYIAGILGYRYSAEGAYPKWNEYDSITEVYDTRRNA